MSGALSGERRSEKGSAERWDKQMDTAMMMVMMNMTTMMMITAVAVVMVVWLNTEGIRRWILQ